LVVDRLESMTRLAGEERTVLRARWDWQLFRRQRTMYGRVFDWHTLEGPCVREREGRYYCFYSGGCYENESYGVDYGVAETVLGPYADAGNGTGPRVLKTVPGRVIGPGHHSIVPGPDERSEWIVYHAWDSGRTARRLCIDRLMWTRDGPRCAGPTWTEQAAVTGWFA
jgi:GH43 family beta-xylosidase